LGAGEQTSFAVNFDRAGAVADTKNFPTGAFTHSLTITTAADGGSSTPTRTATLFGSIVRTTTPSTTSTTTTSTVPVAAVTVSKVAGSLQNCVALSASATVTGKVVSVTITYSRTNPLTNKTEVLGSAPMVRGSGDVWNVGQLKVQIPAGTQKVLLRVTATPSSGAPVSAATTLSTAC
jgi:hypothetical protein